MNNYWIYIDFGILIVIFLFTLIILFYKKRKEDELMDYLVAIKYNQIIDENLRAMFGDGRFKRRYEASSQLVSNFRFQKRFDYLIKYFNLVVNDETLYHISNIYNVQKKAEKFASENRYREKAFEKHTPFFRMYYRSPQGRNYRESTYYFDVVGLKELYLEVKTLLSKQNHAKAQRSAMTTQMRESILRRDNWTCQRCGNSVYKEPNLLLEVDHIIPISKGGKTEPNNLQTLCWKCNRSKSDKIFSPNKDDNGNKKVVFPDDSFVDEEQNVVFPDDNVF